ncbi:MAG TPA: TolC family protein [Thermoguttaceae bacterium]|nr:TolC family protein [Thermoguttaceae bacterium]
MKLDRRIVCASVIAVLAFGGRLPAGQLKPPPEPTDSDDSAVRWIRKTGAESSPPLLQPARVPGFETGIPTKPEVELPEVQEEQPPRQLPVEPMKLAEPRLVAAPPRLARPEPTVAPTVALEPSGMPLAELEEIALANNPTLVQAAMRVQAAQGKRLQAGLYPNPVIGYQAEEMGIGGSAGQHGVFFAQELVTGGKLGLRTAAAGHEVTQAEHAWQAQHARVLNDVRSAGYEVLVAQRIVDLQEKLVGIAGQGVKAADDLLAAMEVSRVDLLQARIEADSAKLELENARHRHLAAWRRLTAVLGTPEMEPAVLCGELTADLPPLSWDGALQLLLIASPQILEAQAGVRRARCALARENVEWIPNVDIQASVRYHDEANDTVTGLEVGLPLPLFNRNQGNICKARAELIAAEREVERIELSLHNRLAATFERYANAENQARNYAAEILPNAKTSLDLVRDGYRQGEFDYLTLLTAQRTYFQVNLAYLESLLAYRSGRVAIEGFLLSGGLGGREG